MSQNRFEYSQGLPPPEATKKLAPRDRSMASSTMATMNMGKAMSPSATLVTTPKTKIGVRFQVMPRARIRTAVVVMLAPASAVETPKMTMVTRKASMPGGAWSDSGAYADHPVGMPPRKNADSRTGTAANSSQ